MESRDQPRSRDPGNEVVKRCQSHNFRLKKTNISSSVKAPSLTFVFSKSGSPKFNLVIINKENVFGCFTWHVSLVCVAGGHSRSPSYRERAQRLPLTPKFTNESKVQAK